MITKSPAMRRLAKSILCLVLLLGFSPLAYSATTVYYTSVGLGYYDTKQETCDVWYADAAPVWGWNTVYPDGYAVVDGNTCRAYSPSSGYFSSAGISTTTQCTGNQIWNNETQSCEDPIDCSTLQGNTFNATFGDLLGGAPDNVSNNGCQAQVESILGCAATSSTGIFLQDVQCTYQYSYTGADGTAPDLASVLSYDSNADDIPISEPVTYSPVVDTTTTNQPTQEVINPDSSVTVTEESTTVETNGGGGNIQPNPIGDGFIINADGSTQSSTTTTTETTTFTDNSSTETTTTTNNYISNDSHTWFIDSNGHVSQNTSEGQSTSGTSSTTVNRDSDGNITSSTTSESGELNGEPCGGAGQPPCAVRIDETGTPDGSTAAPDYQNQLDNTGIQNILDGLATESTPDQSVFSPVLPAYQSCQTLTINWLGHSVTFPDAGQCAKLETAKDMLAYFLYFVTAFYLFKLATMRPA